MLKHKELEPAENAEPFELVETFVEAKEEHEEANVKL